MVRFEAVRASVPGVLDVLGEGVGGANGVFAGNDVQRVAIRTAVDGLCEDGGNELENVGADGARGNVGSDELRNQVLLVRLGVDGAVVCDCSVRGALFANLDDLVRGRGVDPVDERVDDIGKDDFVARVVQEAGDEATAWREKGLAMTCLSGGLEGVDVPMLPAPK